MFWEYNPPGLLLWRQVTNVAKFVVANLHLFFKAARGMEEFGGNKTCETCWMVQDFFLG